MSSRSSRATSRTVSSQAGRRGSERGLSVIRSERFTLPTFCELRGASCCELRAAQEWADARDEEIRVARVTCEAVRLERHYGAELGDERLAFALRSVDVVVAGAVAEPTSPSRSSLPSSSSHDLRNPL